MDISFIMKKFKDTLRYLRAYALDIGEMLGIHMLKFENIFYVLGEVFGCGHSDMTDTKSSQQSPYRATF